jgi:hypothetical protein
MFAVDDIDETLEIVDPSQRSNYAALSNSPVNSPSAKYRKGD